MTHQLLLNLDLPLVFDAGAPCKKVKAALRSPNAARYHQALTAALNIHGVSSSVYAVMLAFATQISRRKFATVIDTAATLATSRNAVTQHLIGSPVFFLELARPEAAPYHERRRFTLTGEAVEIMRKIQRTTTKRYECQSESPPAA